MRRVAVVVAAAFLVACSGGFVPGLGELMSLQQMRHAKLWFAGRDQNWPLADYELDELQEGFDDVVKFHPTHKDAPLPLSEVVPKIMGKPIGDLRAAIRAHEPRAFVASYDALTAGCNACHQATNFGFNVVRRPPGALWYGNQSFPPPAAGD